MSELRTDELITAFFLRISSRLFITEWDTESWVSSQRQELQNRILCFFIRECGFLLLLAPVKLNFLDCKLIFNGLAITSLQKIWSFNYCSRFILMIAITKIFISFEAPFEAEIMRSLICANLFFIKSWFSVCVFLFVRYGKMPIWFCDNFLSRVVT